jgi:hypothetical protein
MIGAEELADVSSYQTLPAVKKLLTLNKSYQKS